MNTYLIHKYLSASFGDVKQHVISIIPPFLNFLKITKHTAFYRILIQNKRHAAHAG